MESDDIVYDKAHQLYHIFCHYADEQPQAQLARMNWGEGKRDEVWINWFIPAGSDELAARLNRDLGVEAVKLGPAQIQDARDPIPRPSSMSVQTAQLPAALKFLQGYYRPRS